MAYLVDLFSFLVQNLYQVKSDDIEEADGLPDDWFVFAIQPWRDEK